MTEEDERAVRAAVDGELRLLDPAVRASPAQVAALLDPEFTEIGASGRRWDATSILTVTGAGTVSPTSPVTVTEMSGTVLAPGVVHLTYLADNQGRRARRSSLWRLTGTGWRCTSTREPRPGDVAGPTDLPHREVRGACPAPAPCPRSPRPHRPAAETAAATWPVRPGAAGSGRSGRVRGPPVEAPPRSC